MKLSVSLTNYSWPVTAIRDETALLAERLDRDGATLKRKLEVLQQLCAEEIERTVTTGFDQADSVESLADRCTRLHALGAQHGVLITHGRPWAHADCDVVAATADRLAAVS